jgi:hypothetical protein
MDTSRTRTVDANCHLHSEDGIALDCDIETYCLPMCAAADHKSSVRDIYALVLMPSEANKFSVSA